MEKKMKENWNIILDNQSKKDLLIIQKMIEQVLRVKYENESE